MSKKHFLPPFTRRQCLALGSLTLGAHALFPYQLQATPPPRLAGHVRDVEGTPCDKQILVLIFYSKGIRYICMMQL